MYTYLYMYLVCATTTKFTKFAILQLVQRIFSSYEFVKDNNSILMVTKSRNSVINFKYSDFIPNDSNGFIHCQPHWMK